MTHKKIEKIDDKGFNTMPEFLILLKDKINEIISALTPEKEEEQAMGSYIEESGLGTVSGGEIYTATSLKEEEKEMIKCCQKCGVPYSICSDPSKPWPYAPCAHIFSPSKEEERCNQPITEYTFCTNKKPCSEHTELWKEIKKSFSPSPKEEWRKQVTEIMDSIIVDADGYIYTTLDKTRTIIRNLLSQAVQEERARVRRHLERQRDALKGHKYQVSAQDVGEQIIGASILFLDNPTQR